MSLGSSSDTVQEVVPFLNDDVLAYIFNLNAHTSETEMGCRGTHTRRSSYVSALDTARRTSQVCGSWRQIMLQSPTIWGNIIDLFSLRQANKLWIEEVLKRTGEARLSVYGEVEDANMREVLMSLLDRNWHRIRRLDIVVFEGDLDHIDYRLWDIFWNREAPNLEKFLVNVDLDDGFNTGRWDGLQLFKGSAPSLRGMHSPCFRFDHRASWISQLLSITLCHPFNLTGALNVIAHTPLLESLVIGSTVEIDRDAPSWTRVIYLPNLQRIDISSNALGSLLCLSHIVPRSDCALRLSLYGNSTDLRKTDDLERVSRIISRYAKGFFDVHRSAELLISIWNLNVEISARVASRGNDNEEAYFGRPGFQVFLHSARYRWIISEVVDTVLSTLSAISDSLKMVENLQFTISKTLSYPGSALADGSMVQVFRSLASVTRMTITPFAMNTLNYLMNSGAAAKALFPHLVELKVKFFSRDEYQYVKSSLAIFLTCCKDAGKPIQTLYIVINSTYTGHCLRLQEADDWAFLREFEGLQSLFVHPGGEVKIFFGPTKLVNILS